MGETVRDKPATPPKQKPRRRRRLVALAGAAVVVAGGVALALWPRAVTVDTATVDRGPLVVTLDEEGRTHLRDRATVTAPVTGHLLIGELRAGDVVAPGQVLAHLEAAQAPLVDAPGRAELAAAVRAAEATLAQATAAAAQVEEKAGTTRDEARRQEKLFAAGASPRVEAEEARAAAQAAEHELAAARFAAGAARAELARQRASLRRALGGATAAGTLLEVRAPLGGVLLTVHREEDGIIAAGEPIVEVGDPASLEVRAEVLTAEAVQVPAGAEVIVTGWGGPDLPGRVRNVEPKAFTEISALGVEEQRTHIVIDLDPPLAAGAGEVRPAQRLGHDWYVDVSIVRWRGDDVVRVPAGALFRRPGPGGADAWGAYVVDEGRARERPITIGHRAGALVEVVAGLSPGDVVVLYPADRVDDGQRVTVRAAAAGSPEAR